MDKSEYLELDSFFLPKTPIPIYSERTPRVFARTFNPPVYHPSYPTRDEVRKSHYLRRQEQAQSQGFYTPNTKPYKEIGGPLILDARQLTILSLTQPTGKLSGGYNILTQLALGAETVAHENDGQLQKRGIDRIAAKDDVRSNADSEESNEQRLRLYRLKHQGEVMDVKKEAKAIQLMSRFASNGLPIFSLLNRVEDFRNMAKHGAFVQASSSARNRSSNRENGKSNDGSLGENSPVLLNNIAEDESSSDESETLSQAGTVNTPSSGPVKKHADPPRPYSAAYYRIGSQAPNDAAIEHLYRQLCALCWLLDAIANTDPTMTICPIVQSWNLQALNNMKVNVQETQQKSTTIDSNWSTFLSHHHPSHVANGAPGIANVKRSNIKQSGSKYPASNAESRRTGNAGFAGGAMLNITTSEGLNDSLDLTLPSDIPSGVLTDRVPPTIVETPTSAAVTTTVAAPSNIGSLPPTNEPTQQLQQQNLANQQSDLAPGADSSSTATSGPQQPQQQGNVVTLHLPNTPSASEPKVDDQRSNKSSSQPRHRSAFARMRGYSAASRSSSSAQGEKKNVTINYHRLMRDREFLTAKLHEVEVEIDREERFRTFRRSSRKSANNNTGGSNSSENADKSGYVGKGGVSKDIAEFTSRAVSARYNSLANRSQHRFKTTAEEQALIVSDTLHQMNNRRMELFRLKFQSLEASSGSTPSTFSDKVTSQASKMSSPRRQVAETFDRATRRLRAKTAAAERERRMAVEQANEERQRDWLGALRSLLPSQLLEDWRCRKILERLERHVGMRPNQTTDLNRFLDTLKTLRAFEICDPDVAAAVEFCRERVLRFPVTEFEDFFRKHFPTVVRPVPVEKKKRHPQVTF